MPSLNMKGPYSLTDEIIDANVEEKIGNYALGVAARGVFAVQYVGRSDTNLNQRLKDHIGEGYTHFEFAYSADPVSAYHKECENYHAFLKTGKLDNEIHPDKPKKAPVNLKCLVCEQ